MSANLPRVFEDVGSGNVKPVDVPLHLSKIGGDFSSEELASVARETVRTPSSASVIFVCQLLKASQILLLATQICVGLTGEKD